MSNPSMNLVCALVNNINSIAEKSRCKITQRVFMRFGVWGPRKDTSYLLHIYQIAPRTQKEQPKDWLFPEWSEMHKTMDTVIESLQHHKEQLEKNDLDAQKELESAGEVR